MTQATTRDRSINHSRDESQPHPKPQPRVLWRAAPDPLELTTCDDCGAVYSRKTWRRAPARGTEVATTRPHGRCPACTQVRAGSGHGRVLLSGERLASLRIEIERRIAHVCARAAFTQPENKLVYLRPLGEGMEVVTTSQQLAHRVARELEKAFGGKARFSWAPKDGDLFATWSAPEVRVAARTAGTKRPARRTERRGRAA